MTCKMNADHQPHEHDAAVIDIPLDRINPDTLRKMIEEFVTREWSELTDGEYTLAEKVGQVLRQLEENRARVVFDPGTETCNIVSADSIPNRNAPCSYS